MPFRHLHLLSAHQPTIQQPPPPPQAQPSIACPYLAGGCPLFQPGESNPSPSGGNNNENYYNNSPVDQYASPQGSSSNGGGGGGCGGGCGGSLAGTSSCVPSSLGNANTPSSSNTSAQQQQSSIYKSPIPSTSSPPMHSLSSLPSPTYPLPMSLSPPATLPQIADSLDSSLWTGPYVDFGFGAQEPQSSSYYSPPQQAQQVPQQQAMAMPSLKRSSPSQFVDIEDIIKQQQRPRHTPQPQQQQPSHPQDLKRSRPNSIDSGYTGGYSPEAIEWARDAPEDDSPATPFISKLVYILAHPDQFGHLVSWDSRGESVILAHAKPETLDILSKFFRHSTVASFVRQLNIYAFKRLSTTDLLGVLDRSLRQGDFNASDYSAFANPLFWRAGGPRGTCSLSGLKPIAKERASRAKKAQAGAGAQGQAQGGGRQRKATVA